MAWAGSAADRGPDSAQVRRAQAASMACRPDRSAVEKTYSELWARRADSVRTRRAYHRMRKSLPTREMSARAHACLGFAASPARTRSMLRARGLDQIDSCVTFSPYLAPREPTEIGDAPRRPPRCASGERGTIPWSFG